MNDKAVNIEERKLCEAKYWQQYNRWHNMLVRLAMAIAQQRGSDFWESLREALHKHWSSGPLAHIEDLVCLCLGKLDDQASIYQLATFVLLAQLLGIPHERCLIYDPVHTSEDRSILAHLGFVALDENKEAKYQVQRMTLFYMPYGPYHLFNNLVQANWHSLHRIAVLGNSFFWVCDPKHGKTKQMRRCRRAPHVEKVLPFIKATNLSDHQAARLVVNRWLEHLECTLTTFPSAIHSAIQWKAESLPKALAPDFACSDSCSDWSSDVQQ